MSRPLLIALLGSSLLTVPAIRDAAGAEPTTQPAPVLRPGQTQADLRAYLVERAPHFVAPSDPGRWHAEAEAIRQRVLDEVVLRGVPGDWLTGEPDVVWGETLPGQGYVIRKLRYEAVPGLWVGGLLYEPEGLKGKVPAVLNPNGHVGKPGMTIDYKQVRCINLARRGMLAFNLEWIGMGQLGSEGYAHNDLSYLDLCGRAGLSVFYLALKRGLDVLCSHEAVDLDRVAVTGLSGGGWQTILISSLDTRVKLAAPNAGFIGLEQRIWNDEDIGDREQNATDLVSVADYPVLTALLYPRPALLIYNAEDDCCFRAERARSSVYRPVVHLYELFGLVDHFAFHVNHDPGTHNYLKDNRQAFYRFLNRHFLPQDQRQDEEIPVDDEIRKAEELAIEYPADNANFHTLAAEAMKSLPARKVPRDDPAAIDQWRSRTRDMLRRTVRPDPVAAVGPQDVLALSTIPDRTAGVPGHACCLRVAGQWTLPVVEYAPEGSDPAVNYLILADGGLADARDAAAEVIGWKGRAIVADVLFTGECMPSGGGAWKHAQMISTVGRRCLGIQVSQLDVLIEHVRSRHADHPLRIVTKGRVAGLAALVSTALKPGRLDHLELRQMDASLKDLLANKVTYRQAPSMFCFGLLEVADVPEMIALADPTRVDLPAAD